MNDDYIMVARAFPKGVTNDPGNLLNYPVGSPQYQNAYDEVVSELKGIVGKNNILLQNRMTGNSYKPTHTKKARNTPYSRPGNSGRNKF